MVRVQGIAVAPGLALGPVHVVRARPDVVPTWVVRDGEVELELARLNEAIDRVSVHLEQHQESARRLAGEKDAGIFAVHRMILQDPGARAEVTKAIHDDRCNAEAAVQALVGRLRRTMSGLEGDSVRAYAADVSEPWSAVLDELLQRDREVMAATDERVVLAAAELTPQVVTFLARERILAIVAESGGRFSHGAVLARSFGIPCVIGVPNLLARLEQNLTVLVDGDNGAVDLRPDELVQADFLERCRRRVTARAALSVHAAAPAITPDGRSIGVQVNLESVRDLESFDPAHTDGVGLLRTEFLYMERREFPSEEEQLRLYRRVIEAMQGRPVTIRTLDIGGDKQLPYFQTPRENNPALGWRGIRVTLEWRELMRVQLRAILRASAYGEVRVLLPMITSLEEVDAVREVFEDTRAKLVAKGYEVALEIPVGVMIEVPSTVWILDELLAVVDFLSVGTNDLIQYTLAVDRDNALVAGMYDPYHPAIMRVLGAIAAAARRAGKPVGICGEIAGDESMALLLLGLGFDSLSAAPHFLGELRQAIRCTTETDAQALARLVLAARSPTAIRALLARAQDQLHRRCLAAK
ncbi:MAG: phosphoenolpyruvate--protein phosphotransferase [Planctomycetota bacterium]